jgi:hypothetical protein
MGEIALSTGWPLGHGEATPEESQAMHGNDSHGSVCSARRPTRADDAGPSTASAID